MRLRLDPGDEPGYVEARAELLTALDGWPLRRAAVTGDVGVLLDWKFHYGDGDLASWTTADLHEFLLDWLPRKVIMPPESAAPFVASLREFFPFLAAERLLGLGSSSAKALDDTLRRSTPRLAAALADRSTFGMAKSLLTGAGEEFFEIDLGPDRPGVTKPNRTRFTWTGRIRPNCRKPILAMKSGAIRYPAASIPNVVARANQAADVRQNALAVR